MIETAQNLIGNLTTLAIGAAVVIAIAMILWSWVVQRTVSAFEFPCRTRLPGGLSPVV